MIRIVCCLIVIYMEVRQLEIHLSKLLTHLINLENCEFISNLCFVSRKMLSLGASKPWPDALEIITGQRKMEASALVEYFKPLIDWLEKKNKETGAHIGWNSQFECLSKSDVEKAKQ